MSDNIRYEIQLVLMSMFSGIQLMVAYDCLRVFRLIVKHRPLLVGLEDMIYWFYATIVIFSLLYRQSDGILRCYTIGTVVLVMFLYNYLISRKLLYLLKKMMKYIKMRLCKHRNR